MTLVARRAALEELLALLDRRYRDGYAMPPNVLAAMSAADGKARGDRDR